MAHPVSPNQLSTAERIPPKPKPVSSPKTHLVKTDDNETQCLSNGVLDRQTDIIASSSSSSSSFRLASEEGPTISSDASNSAEENGRDRLKRHRVEMSGRVWIPDIWGQEDFLKDWTDCSAFDACLGPNGLMSARASLAEEGRRATLQVD